MIRFLGVTSQARSKFEKASVAQFENSSPQGGPNLATVLVSSGYKTLCRISVDPEDESQSVEDKEDDGNPRLSPAYQVLRCLYQNFPFNSSWVQAIHDLLVYLNSEDPLLSVPWQPYTPICSKKLS